MILNYIYATKKYLNVRLLEAKTSPHKSNTDKRDDKLKSISKVPEPHQVFDSDSIRAKRPDDDSEDLYCVPTKNAVGFIATKIDEINKHALRRMEHMVQEGYDKISLFIFGNSVIETSTDDLGENLDRLMNYFIETEQYEFAGRIRDLRESNEK